MVPEIKVGDDYFIGALGNYKDSDKKSLIDHYQFFDETFSENQYTNYDFCIRLHVASHDKEKFHMFVIPENCTTINYCLCEKLQMFYF